MKIPIGMELRKYRYTMAIRILLVDNYKLFRQGLRQLLEQQRDIIVVGEASDGRQAVELARENKPDIVLMHAEMPNMEVIEATSRIRSRLKKTRIVALTMHRDKNYVTAMLRAGVSGYVSKGCDAKELVDAVREVIAGRGYISSDVAPLILADYSAQRSTPKRELDEREIKVLRMLSEGMNIKDIAERLSVSAKTIERERNQLMEKLKLHSIAALTKYAIRKGFSDLS